VEKEPSTKWRRFVTKYYIKLSTREREIGKKRTGKTNKDKFIQVEKEEE
jgi:hypothetical protein